LDLRPVLVFVFARPPAGQGGEMIIYRGPAKPIRLWRRPMIDYVESVVFLSGIVIVGLDVYVWRANIVL
jgi:hypothetical protein